MDKKTQKNKVKIGFKPLDVVDYLKDFDPLIKRQANKRKKQVESLTDEEQAKVIVEEYLNEILTVKQRKVKGINARRNRRKLQLGARRARNRIATKKVIDKRNRRTSRLTLARQFAKGKAKKDLSVGRKQEIERRLLINNPRIKRIALPNRIKTIRRDRGILKK